MRLEPGAKFDRFTVEALLGEGGMGQVYRALDERLQRRVALKILRPREGGDAGEGRDDRGDRISLILREARAAAALDHPNAVSVFELGEHEGVPFMAMELISGAPLRALVGRSDVPMDQRLVWLLDVARALEAAHRAGIVHLDIKPENVMVRSDGVVKVLDFGIARRSDFVPDPADKVSWENARSTTLTQGSALVGTVPYMAPEQVHRQPLDGRTDEFAWGVLAYELCTGSIPWPTTGSAFDLLSAILTKTPPALSTVCPEVPPAVSAVVARALAKAPADRYPGMAEVVGALGTALGAAQPIRSARPLPISVQPPDPEARRRLADMLTESSHVSGDLAAKVSALAATTGPPSEAGAPPRAVTDVLTAAPGSQRDAIVHGLLETTPVPTDASIPPLALRATQRSGEPPSGRGPETDALPSALDQPFSDRGSGPPTPAVTSSARRLSVDATSGPATEEHGVTTRRSPGADARAQPLPPSDRVRVETREGGSYPGLSPDAQGSPPSEPARREPASSVGSARPAKKVPLEMVWTTLAVAVALGLLLWKSVPAATPPALPVASASAAPESAPATAPTALTALPTPTDCNPTALAEYKAGIQAMHDGIWEQARQSFQKAVAADDHCAEAHLRLVMTGQAFHLASEARKVYLRAVTLRTQLSERDQGLLRAYEPLVRSDPANHREARERLAELARRYPGDAEIAYLDADTSEDPDHALASAERALAVDPSYSDAWQTKGRALAVKGKIDEALAVLDECLRAAPNSADCVRESTTHLRRTGRCAEMEKAARTWTARDPTTAEGYLKLAEALASEGSPREAIAEALRQRWARLDEAERAQREPFEAASLDALMGDFESAAGRARALAQRVDADPNYEPHVRPAIVRLGVLAETGQRTEAALVASEFLKRKAAWSSTLTPDSGDAALYAFEPRLIAAARSPGFGKALEAWTATMRDAGILKDEVLWALNAALPAETAAQAEAALASMPARLLSSDGYLRAPAELSGAFVGRALLLAGHADQAVSFLRVTTRSCFALDDPLVHTQAFLWLGQALEQQKDTEGACAAYRRVEERWQKARPRSVTAEEAARRAAALKCPR
jgi:serine/threonine-protein kinase